MSEPITVGLVSGTILELEKNLFDKIIDLKDTWRIFWFTRHVENKVEDKKIVADIIDLKSRLIEAIVNSDFKRMRFLLFVLLSRCEKTSKISSLALALTIEECVVNFSKYPNIIEDSLFIVNLSFERYLSEWEKDVQPIYFENTRGLFLNNPNTEEAFNAPFFIASCCCVGILYRICLKSAELSQENLIRVGNFLFSLAAEDPQGMRRCNFFDIIYLALVIHIAAKAKTLNIEPMKENLSKLLKHTNSERLEEAFNIAQDNSQNPFAKMGNIEIILATNLEILLIKDEICPQIK